MKSILTAILASFLALLPGSNALADHGLGLELETRAIHNWGKLGNKGDAKFQSNEIRVGAHKQLGNAPLSLGLSAGYTNADKRSSAFAGEMGPLYLKGKAADGKDLAVEVKAWLPESVVGNTIRPYARLAHTVYSDFQTGGNVMAPDLKLAGYKVKGSHNGLTVGVGAGLNLTDSLAANAEYNYQAKRMKLNGDDLELNEGTRSHGISVGLAYTF